MEILTWQTHNYDVCKMCNVLAWFFIFMPSSHVELFAKEDFRQLKYVKIKYIFKKKEIQMFFNDSLSSVNTNHLISFVAMLRMAVADSQPTILDCLNAVCFSLAGITNLLY